MDLDGENPELRHFASYCREQGGAAWVSGTSSIEGMIAVTPSGSGTWEIKRLYVARAHRGTGLAPALLATAEAHATAAGATQLVLWSDTRFEPAHRFYEKHSYLRAGGIRHLGDASNTIEFGYAKPLGPLAIERLDAAAAASATRRLATLLVACVDSGAAVSFLPPLAPARAEAFWRTTATRVATGGAVLLAAWTGGVLSGSVTLGLDTPDNQPHRAEISKLLVHPEARRRGLARALMQRAEDEVRAANRSLDTRANDAAEPLYRTLGWQEAGRIPGYAFNADGQLHETVIFYKPLRSA